MQSCIFYVTIILHGRYYIFQKFQYLFYILSFNVLILIPFISLLTNKREAYTIKQEHTFDGGCYEEGKKFQSSTTS